MRCRGNLGQLPDPLSCFQVTIDLEDKLCLCYWCETHCVGERCVEMLSILPVQLGGSNSLADHICQACDTPIV